MSSPDEFSTLSVGEEIFLRVGQNALTARFAGIDRDTNVLLIDVPSSAGETSPQRQEIPVEEIESWSKNSERQSRGLLDGSLNNPNIIDHVAVLNTNINSDPATVENRNANTRASGSKNNSSFQ